MPIYRSKKWPSKSQWAQIFDNLTKKEKVALFSCFVLCLGSLAFVTHSFYLKHTQPQPAMGGIYREGVIGNPRFISPIYASSEADRALVELVFSGLMKYDSQGNIVPDLAECNVAQHGKAYQCKLKENIFWHDGKKLTAKDVVFTIKTIQNPNYKSPLRPNWLGVKVEKISENEIYFKLKNSYSAFPERLTLKIIPAHIWQNISPQNFPLSFYNLKPIGSGPYLLQNLNQDQSGFAISLTLKRFPKYFGKVPKLSKISFQFFDNKDSLLSAAQSGQIDGFSISSAKNINSNLHQKFNSYSFSFPRYFAVFFNLDDSILKQKEIRQAINYGTDKKQIIQEVLSDKGKEVYSPILPEIYGFSLSFHKIYKFNPEKAQKFLEKAGFVENKTGKRFKILKQRPAFQFKSNLRLGSRGKEVRELQKCLAKDSKVYPEGKITGYFGKLTRQAVIKFQEKYPKDILDPWGFKKGTGLISKTTRAKLNHICFPSPKKTLLLSLSLATAKDPLLIETAALLKKQWQKLGFEVTLKTFDISTLEREVIKKRNYQALLFGQVLGKIPDPYPFWHSSQIKDPGLNLAKYENKEVDRLLEKARLSMDPEFRAKKYQKFQEILMEDAPALFLYSPDYIYLVSKKIRGIRKGMITEPAKRFAGIGNWYIKTKRAWK